jgi:maleate isomerase
MSGEIRIGVLTPHAAAGPEAEFPAMAPGRVLTCVARVSADAPAVGGGADPTTPSAPRELTAPPLLDEAAELLARGSVDAIGYASTSSGYAIGFDAETALVTRLSRGVGVPVVATCAAAVLALRVLDVGRIALVDPPWFDAELTSSVTPISRALTSNQALLWSLLAQAGATFEVSGHCRLFSHKPRAPIPGRAGRASQRAA